ncbi:DUF2589 domain-containing protein [Thalassotalea sp. LPB0316]|uniref:DUF2589 domain-containing protein n=1 Tax=Thalassotalea sp. LPB0316 TaxID=2769490 RepID=UPI001868B54F|nr:DUF2589 domain-containing protein [Thalassotalea sp. LPB0316]QOL25219.1 DUF2589 domain-containing protein [Thalassotalea sp. LPB0316]
MPDQDRALVSMAQQFSGLPIKSLISAPLIAGAEANAKMAITQTQFLLSTCFDITEGEGGSDYKPIMINMTLTRSVVKADGTAGTPVETKFDLPLLTIMPLNSLAVDNIDVNFEMEVKSSFSNDKETSSEVEKAAEGSFSAKAGWGCFSVEVSGSVSASSRDTSSEKSHYEKSNSAKYTINAHAGQLPLPEGVTTIIQAFSQNIAPIQLKAESNG